jgi:amino-acid racemase
MKTIGMLGGMSWESTQVYYKLVNEEIRKRLGKLHSAKIILYSLDFEEIEMLQHKGDWDATEGILKDGARRIQAGGADFLLICTNTMHKVAPAIESSLNIPILHIADAAATHCLENGYNRVGLLGTRFTMEQDFYKGRLLNKYGIEVMVPREEERAIVHQVIYDELCNGMILEESRNKFIRIIENLSVNGAQAVILGCTEIPLLFGGEKINVPLVDTTYIHAMKAVEEALR